MIILTSKIKQLLTKNIKTRDNQDKITQDIF